MQMRTGAMWGVISGSEDSGAQDASFSNLAGCKIKQMMLDKKKNKKIVELPGEFSCVNTWTDCKDDYKFITLLLGMIKILRKDCEV